MSDRYVPLHSRDVDNPPAHLTQKQKQRWVRAAKKAKLNYEYSQQYPAFYVSTSNYRVEFINKYTKSNTLQLLIDHVADCTQFTFDTESERSTNQLALIQIQTRSHRLPAYVIIVELAHLSSHESSLKLKIKQIFDLIFRPGNMLFSWGSLSDELHSAVRYDIFNWPITAMMIDVQERFPAWYSWALSHCEMCSLSSQCSCHDPTPYSTNEKWSLQHALVYSSKLFLDKSLTMNNWAIGLDPKYSSLSTARRGKMVTYAIYDCFATSYFIRPVLERWTFQQVMTENLIHVFQESSNSFTQRHTTSNVITMNINPNSFMSMYAHELELISDDDDDEVQLNQCVQRPLNYDIGLEPISDDERANALEVHGDEVVITEPHMDLDSHVDSHNVVVDVINPNVELPREHSSTYRRRSDEARKIRNRKRNNIHRSRRYRYRITRIICEEFQIKSIKIVLEQFNVHYKHIKIVKDMLLIGVKNRQRRQEYNAILSPNLFDYEHYVYFQAHGYV